MHSWHHDDRPSSLVPRVAELSLDYWLLQNVLKQAELLLGWFQEIDVQVHILCDRPSVFDPLFDLLGLVSQTHHLVSKQQNFEEGVFLALEYRSPGVNSLLVLHEMVIYLQLLFNLYFRIGLRNLDFFAFKLLFPLSHFILLLLGLQDPASSNIRLAEESLGPESAIDGGVGLLLTFGEEIHDHFLISKKDLRNFEFATLFSVI